MLRVVAIALLLLSQVTVSPGCESCAFSFGTLGITGQLKVDGAVPADLRVRICETPSGTGCDPGRLTPVVDGVFELSAEAPSEEVEGPSFHCEFDKRFLVVDGTGCTTVVTEVIGTDEIPVSDPVTVTLDCG